MNILPRCLRLAGLAAFILVALVAPALSRTYAMPTLAQTHKVYVPIAARHDVPLSIDQQVLALINQQRHNNGCNVDLTISPNLKQAADRHSADMATHDFFSHTGSDGSSMVDRIVQSGYHYSMIAENIAAGYSTPQQVVEGWMKSDGHRANILNCSLRETGIGYYYQSNDQPNVKSGSSKPGGPYYYYWTQDFGSQ